MYDIIGDVHGHVDKLVQLLETLGYREQQGVFQHPTRQLISLGDLIDKGPYQCQTVDLLRSMQQAGQANVIMANHEFNAVSWALKNEQGEYLRPHSDKNYQQHDVFLQQAGYDSPWYRDAIAWFQTLPLMLENDYFRCVHASWDTTHIGYLKQHLDAQYRLMPHQWADANDKAHPLYKAIEHCLKGPERLLPESEAHTDPYGHVRRKQRIAWWSEPTLADEYPVTDKPIFFGHYWMKGQPTLHTDKLACLDWSVARNGVLAAYRYDGESRLSNSKIHWI